MKTGTTLKDGTIYVGEHPAENGYLVCKQNDEPYSITINEQSYTLHYQHVLLNARKNTEGMRLPTIDELNLLLSYYNKINGFMRSCWRVFKDSPNDPVTNRWFQRPHLPVDESKTYVRLVKTITQEELDALS